MASTLLCVVCNESLIDQATPCPKCGSPCELLQTIIRASQREHFLFGRVRQPLAELRSEAPKKPTPAKPKAKPKKEKPTAKPMPTEAGELKHAELIELRDAEEETPPPPPKNRGSRWVAHSLDVFLCLGLNYLILNMITIVSPGQLSSLVTFKLIPILFVLLCFTFLYFWLFMGLFKKTLGRLIIDTLRGKPIKD